jgi:peptide/nickel transport system substrate-binding protein
LNVAADLPVLPLYQKPTYLGYNENIQNVVDNPTNSGPTWNAGEWQLTE